MFCPECHDYKWEPLGYGPKGVVYNCTSCNIGFGHYKDIDKMWSNKGIGEPTFIYDISHVQDYGGPVSIKESKREFKDLTEIPPIIKKMNKKEKEKFLTGLVTKAINEKDYQMYMSLIEQSVKKCKNLKNVTIKCRQELRCLQTVDKQIEYHLVLFDGTNEEYVWCVWAKGKTFWDKRTWVGSLIQPKKEKEKI